VARTDIHRPSIINPEDYEFVAYGYLGPFQFEFMRIERERFAAHMAKTGAKFSGHEHGGNCMVCGSVNCIYTANFYHKPTNTYVKTGLECADKLGCMDAELFRKRVVAAREQLKGKKKAQALLTDYGLARAWEIYEAEQSPGCVDRNVNILTEIVGNFVKYGSLSDKQQGFLRTLVERIDNRERVEAERKAANEAAAPLPVTGERTVIRGTVLSVKQVDEYVPGFGFRMLVQHESGWKVLGSVPSVLVGKVSRGDVVEFQAKINPSKNDPKFGYFSRPTKPVLNPA
jgi:hypothetical protein